jgi:SAM-dependent methyltransferase
VADPARMREFWDERSREDAFFFVDDTLDYGHPDLERFWSGGQDVVDGLTDVLGFSIGADEEVVDLGCGLGRVTRVLAARARKVHAIDVSGEMLRRARELNADLPNVAWQLGDGTTLQPLSDASIDGVFSWVVFQHIPDPEITLGYVREMGRVLRPGGWAAFQISNDPSLHRATIGLRDRVKAAIGRAPKGQDEPQWLGSAVDLQDLTAAAFEGGLDIATFVGEGTQFCYVRAVKPD